ncbi:hypothetical protein PBRA_009141 [Plasmodiophora brassicae]|uniref:Uncharacterized protein n=1 Tax=Plasmodiophora brassicae TaxID=37360 RepID=A0A0G4J4V7_PLABS|nr:hypothetical protein PBRA_009141 [Plasmodiophora brassicae]
MCLLAVLLLRWVMRRTIPVGQESYVRHDGVIQLRENNDQPPVAGFVGRKQNQGMRENVETLIDELSGQRATAL